MLRTIMTCTATATIALTGLGAPAMAHAANPVKTPAGWTRKNNPDGSFVLYGPGRCDRRSYTRHNTLVANFGGGDWVAPEKVVAMLYKNGIRPEEIGHAQMVMFGESLNCPKTVHNNLNSKEIVTSQDYGIAQWNIKYHPEITKSMAMDPQTAVKFFARKYNAAGGKSNNTKTRLAAFRIWHASKTVFNPKGKMGTGPRDVANGGIHDAVVLKMIPSFMTGFYVK